MHAVGAVDGPDDLQTSREIHDTESDRSCHQLSRPASSRFGMRLDSFIRQQFREIGRLFAGGLHEQVPHIRGLLPHRDTGETVATWAGSPVEIASPEPGGLPHHACLDVGAGMVARIAVVPSRGADIGGAIRSEHGWRVKVQGELLWSPRQ
jgi:hypothetical protein